MSPISHIHTGCLALVPLAALLKIPHLALSKFLKEAEGCISCA